jgi:tRNA A-37 threonylcarbamoyl transferase component Bud32
VADSLLPGAIIANRYTLHRLIGAGGMSSVWAATHLVTRKAVALKFLKPELAQKKELRQRFLREARAASAVRHPNVVQIHDVLELEDRSPVMVMDLLEGESLASLIAREGALPLAEVARLLLPAVSAIGTAHALGIVHRDLKPDNLFLVSGAAAGPEVRVLDFGIAKLTGVDGDAAQSAALTRTGSMLGTLYYMSPEQTYGERDVDHRTDVWALGVILYECLTGRRPTDGQNIGQIIKSITTGTFPPLARVARNLPPDVTDLVARMLEADRNARPQDLREVLSVLERHTSSRAESRDGATAGGRAIAPLSWRTGLAAIAGSAAVAVATWLVVARPGPRQASAPQPGATPPALRLGPAPLPQATLEPIDTFALPVAAQSSTTAFAKGLSTRPATRPVAAPPRSGGFGTSLVDAGIPRSAPSLAATASGQQADTARGPGGLVVRPGF